MKSVDQLIHLFRNQGLRITPQRRLIFELLSGDESHPTAEDVYQRILQVMPDVSQATVYNTLHELVTMGELAEVKVSTVDGQRYDTNNISHHHLYCTRCHKITDIEGEFGSLALPSEKMAGYQIEKSQVTFYGVCPDCREN
jgi:Fe2+ or Zn2+ uptake regulation protein